MAEVDTSFYPKSDPNGLLGTVGNVANIRNTLTQNRLMNIEAQRQGVGLSQDKIDYAHKQYEGLSGMIGSLAQDPRVGTADGPALVQQYAQNAVKMGYISPEMAQTALSTMPQDFHNLPQWLQTMNVQVMDGRERFGQIYGTPQTISNGNTLQPVAASPLTGIRPISAPIQLQTSPGERAGLVTTQTPSGQPVTMTAGQAMQQAGVNPLTAMPQSAPSQIYNQLVPPADQGAGEPQQASGPGFISGPAPGVVESAKTNADNSTKMLNTDQANERNYQADVIPLEKARDALVQLGTRGTGPGKEQLNEIQSFLISQGILPASESVKNFDEARKYLVQYARSVGDTGTNDKLAAAFAGNPSTGISNAAAVDVVKTALALRRLQNARVQAFAATNEPPANYAKWAVNWASNQDPVAYGFDMMSPQARNAYYQGLKPAQKQKFLSSLQMATQLGLVTPPGSE